MRIAFAKPPAPGRLLADAAARERSGLVAEPGRLAADTDLDEDEVGVLDGPLEVAAERQLAGEALALEHPPGQAADDLEPPGIDVVEREPLDLEPGQPRDELRRVRRTCADDRELHPFTPVSVTPSTKARWARKNRMITGAITTSVAAIVRFHCTWWRLRYWERPDRHGPVRRVLAGVEERQEEVVEGVEDGEERDRRDRRLRQAQHDRGQDPQLAAAVDARGVEVLLRDRQEELAQQEDREGVAETRRG